MMRELHGALGAQRDNRRLWMGQGRGQGNAEQMMFELRAFPPKEGWGLKVPPASP